jgi:sugar/nucleoside kinase (ribokinase family)
LTLVAPNDVQYDRTPLGKSIVSDPDHLEHPEIDLLDRILSSIAKNPSIGVVGIASWDTLLAVDAYPGPGEFALVTSIHELPGGTTANAAVAAAKLGARVELVSAVGDDAAGRELIRGLRAAGVDTSRVLVRTEEPTDQTTIITSSDPPNRTILWRQGAIPRRGDRIDVDRLFTRDLVLLDSVDPALRRFLIDLPVHTYPGVKILIPMTYVVDFPGQDELDSIARCDALVGSEAELLQLTATDSLAAAVPALQALMRVSNLRWAAATMGSEGAIAFDADVVYSVPAIDVEVVDTTGAGDAFAGALAVALASRTDLYDALVLANCVAGLSVRSIGAQSALPAVDEVAPALTRWLGSMPW